jgi:hypothetical protein
MSEKKGVLSKISSVLSPTGDLDQSKFFEHQVNLKAKYNVKSDDSKTYQIDSERNTQKVSKCLVHITCETARIIKGKLQEYICIINNDHKASVYHLVEMEKIFNQIPKEMRDKLKPLQQELVKSKTQIDEIRNKLRTIQINLKEPLDCFVFLKHFREPIKAKIIALEPKSNGFNIRYHDENNKEKFLSDIKFDQLCIGQSNENITKPVDECILQNNPCQMGGAIDDSVSTDSLC